jgi:hypothetical protein
LRFNIIKISRAADNFLFVRKVSGGKIEVYYVGIESVKIITVLEKVLRGAVLGILALAIPLQILAQDYLR